jgi:hypothetical protein
MGAQMFEDDSMGATAGIAFDHAVEEARYMNGHGGYSGTLAEKHDFKVVLPEGDETPEACVDRHIELDTFGDKWGPAGCVYLGDNKYRFFGWASS